MYMFEPSELDCRNVRGVANKKPLDPEKNRKDKRAYLYVISDTPIWTWGYLALTVE